MRGLGTLLLKLTGLLLVLIVVLTAVAAYRGSWLRSAELRSDLDCRPIALPGTVRDMQLDQRRGIVYLAVADGAVLFRDPPVGGTILELALNRRPLRAQPALDSEPGRFSPGGLDLYVDRAGERYLFVVNPAGGRDAPASSVELFRQDWSGEFRHWRSFADPLFARAEDVVGVGTDRFYLAGGELGPAAVLMQLAGIGRSSLVYFDSETARELVEDVAWGGGIDASADGQTLYLSETAAQRIRVLEREPVTGDLTEIRRVETGSSPHRIDVAADGSLWIGAHPNTLKLLIGLATGETAPSEVLRLRLRGDAVERERVFADDGGRISAGAVAIAYRDLLVIGSLTEPELLICESAEE